ncbi:hypothetical protein [Melittangium boletus]|uniref:hypothetical protein n=1 Tax=Melittangium boletus TaxID=83453 RepID=UPI003DA2DEC5
MSLVKELYEPYVLPTRARLATEAVVRRLGDGSLEPHVLERFFLQYHALGVYLTEPLESWVRREGQRCLFQGLDALGKALLAQARPEAQQHVMLMDDTRLLVRRWNLRRPCTLHAERLLAQFPTDAMRDWRLHVEETLTEEPPGAQLALAYELGHFHQTLGPVLLAHVARALGREALDGLTFLKENAQPATGRALTQARLMEDLLRTMPENAQVLAERGAGVLDIHLRFLEDCLQSAEAAVWSPPPPGAPAR